ncbi:MAG: hypothetical protein IH945_01520 [Armatimonadetes bacterium]|nr:hypothetical protein [Armatimonadota bacterium]
MLRTNHMAKRAFTFLAGAAAVAALVGCGGVSESDLVGKWITRTDTEAPAGSGAAGQGAEVAKDFFAPRLELKEDHTYTLAVGILMEGTWELEDLLISLITKSLGSGTQ